MYLANWGKGGSFVQLLESKPSTTNAQPETKKKITRPVVRTMELLGGRNSTVLTAKIAKILGIEPMECKIGNFPNGEIFVSLVETVRRKDVFIIQSTSLDPNNSHMELCILIQAATIAGAEEITVVLPGCAYERQDRKKHGRESITSSLTFDQLKGAGRVDRFLTLDLHTAMLQGNMADRPADHFYATEPMTKWMQENWLNKNRDDQFVIVSPDNGGMGRVSAYAHRLGLDTASIDKKRSESGKTTPIEFKGDVQGKVAILVDDMIDTAGTITEGSKFLKNECGAKRVLASATYPLFSGSAVERLLDSPIEELMVSDALQIPDSKIAALGSRISIVSIAPLLAEAIRRQFLGESLSDIIGWHNSKDTD